MSTYLSKAFHDFFIELAANNHKDWMDANKKRYQNDVKKPFENLVAALQDEVSSFDEPIELKPGNAIFRINRDIRFSKDKTPYKTDRSAIISKYGRKDKMYPGYYLSVSPEKVMIGGGAYFLDKDNLFKVRQEIAYNMDEFEQLINDSKFVKHFGKVLGEKNKVLPKEFKADAEKQPLIYNKGFYFMKELDANFIFDKDLIKKIGDYYQAALPFNQFLRRAIVDIPE